MNPKTSEILPLEEPCLLVLCGPAKSGKTTYAKRWFHEQEIVSEEQACALLNMSTTSLLPSQKIVENFFTSWVDHRLEIGSLTVIDGRNLHQEERRKWVQLARHHQMAAFLYIFDQPPTSTDDTVLAQTQQHWLQQTLRFANQEGFRQVFQQSQFAEQGPAPLRYPLPVTHHHDGPLDIIGDVHGCYRELIQLLEKLGYTRVQGTYRHPDNRIPLFLGDLTDRGPNSLAVLEFVTHLHAQGRAIYVPGNHCDKLARYLQGASVQLNHGIETTVQELEELPPNQRQLIRQRFLSMFESASPYLLLDQNKLLAAHAGLPERYHGRMSKRIRSFSLYGDVSGKVDASGHPTRRDWARDYHGRPLVVYGHTPTPYPRFVNNTLNLDQGCVFGGALSALRYPERDIVTVPAQRIYWRGNAATHPPEPPSSPQEQTRTHA